MYLALTYTPHWLQTENSTLCGFDHISAWVAVTVAAVLFICGCIMQAPPPPGVEFTHCVRGLWALTWHAGHMSSTGHAGCTGSRHFYNITLLQSSQCDLYHTDPIITCCFSFFWFLAALKFIELYYPATQGACFVRSVFTFSFFRLYLGLFYLTPCPPSLRFCTCVTLVLPSGLHWGLSLSPADNYCHLHVARCDKHLALPVASHRTTMLA